MGNGILIAVVSLCRYAAGAMNATDNAAETAGRRGGPATAPAVSPADILDILGVALRDFRAAPAHDLVLGGFYAVGGWLLVLLLLVLDLSFLVYPLAAGFALVAPFMAAAFYAVSHILERGETVTWRGIFASACPACWTWSSRRRRG